jgi:hypothetical protein
MSASANITGKLLDDTDNNVDRSQDTCVDVKWIMRYCANYTQNPRQTFQNVDFPITFAKKVVKLHKDCNPIVALLGHVRFMYVLLPIYTRL